MVESVAFSPDGRFALSGSGDDTLILWDVATGDPVRTFTGHTGSVPSVAFSPDGRFILSGSRDNSVRLRDTDYRDFIAYACTRVTRDFTQDYNSYGTVMLGERNLYGIADDEAPCPNLPN
jgi:WD40 repeat protein